MEPAVAVLLSAFFVTGAYAQGWLAAACTSGSIQNCFGGQPVSYVCVTQTTFSIGTPQFIGWSCPGGISTYILLVYSTPDGGVTFVQQNSIQATGITGLLLRLSWQFTMGTANSYIPSYIQSYCPAGSNPSLVNPYSSAVSSFMQAVKTMVVSNQTPLAIAVTANATAATQSTVTTQPAAVVSPGATQSIATAGASASTSTAPVAVNLLSNFIGAVPPMVYPGQTRASIIVDTLNSVTYYILQRMLSATCIQFFMQTIQFDGTVISQAARRNVRRRLLQTGGISTQSAASRGNCIPISATVWQCFSY
eukprot:TRINITY_DN653_c0_g1_i4.p1 TRINITY_DN653_c0_g1~~TRINITY_DN653_c0_g1_i4.p1  ORF type:complete len:307 (-),score=35.89 TRINITY_DN653_c0_g1_i4:310-1230(-)